MHVLESDKLKIEIEILRQILSSNKNSNIIDRKGLQEFLEDKQLMYNRIIRLYEEV